MLSNFKSTPLSVKSLSVTNHQRLVSGSACNLVSGYPKYGTINTAAKWSYMRGWNTPNFHARKRRGELLPITHFDQAMYEGQCTPCYLAEIRKSPYCVQNEWTKYRFTALKENWELPDLYPDIETVNIDYYVQKAAAAVYEQGYDLLTAAGEMPETVRMVRSALKQVIALRKAPLSELRKILRRNPANLFRDQYLNVRYGIRPLIGDIKDLADVLSTFDSKRTRFSQRAGENSPIPDLVEVSVPYNSVALKVSRTVVQTHELSLRGGVIADFKPSMMITNPFLAGWELLPLSFVVDRLCNVGQWIASLSLVALSSQIVSWGGYQLSIIRQTTETGSAGTLPSTYSYTFSGASNLETWQFQKRWPVSMKLHPLMMNRVDLDFFRDILSLAKSSRLILRS